MTNPAIGPSGADSSVDKYIPSITLGSHRRILCVDSNGDTRLLLSLLFRAAGYEVASAEDVNEALRVAQTQHFDLYVLEKVYPGACGFTLCSRIREFDRSTPVLFFTASVSDRDRRKAFESGAQSFMGRPGDFDELLATVCLLTGPDTIERTAH
jgi:DNA-binding response OmpR family regulator